MTKFRTTLTLLASILAAAATVAPASAQVEPSARQEWRSHPNLVRAVRACELALADLQRAPDDFGGNKAQAMTDLRASIHSLRKAIFFRTHMDDRAIDRANY
jgi:hypothetical protein